MYRRDKRTSRPYTTSFKISAPIKPADKKGKEVIKITRVTKKDDTSKKTKRTRKQVSVDEYLKYGKKGY